MPIFKKQAKKWLPQKFTLKTFKGPHCWGKSENGPNLTVTVQSNKNAPISEVLSLEILSIIFVTKMVWKELSVAKWRSSKQLEVKGMEFEKLMIEHKAGQQLKGRAIELEQNWKKEDEAMGTTETSTTSGKIKANNNSTTKRKMNDRNDSKGNRRDSYRLNWNEESHEHHALRWT